MRKKWLCYLMVAGMLGSNTPITVQAGAGVKCTNVTGNKVTLATGSSFTLKTNASTKNLSFTSSNTEVAEVDSKGVISTLKKGKTVVTVSNKKNSTSKKIKVTVAAPKGYTISNVSGTYAGSVSVKIKAKKGYKVYYAKNGKFSTKKVIKSKKSKTLKLTKTTNLTLYVFKNNSLITKSAKEKNKVVYQYVVTSNADATTVQETAATTTQVTATTQAAATTAQGNGTTAQAVVTTAQAANTTQANGAAQDTTTAQGTDSATQSSEATSQTAITTQSSAITTQSAATSQGNRVTTEAPAYNVTTQMTATTQADATTEATTPVSTAEYVKATVLTNPITTATQSVSIQYSLQKETDATFTIGLEPGTLERYEDGEWKEVSLISDEIIVPSIAMLISKDSVAKYTLPLQQYYGKNITEGKYRFNKGVWGGDDSKVMAEFNVIAAEGVTGTTTEVPSAGTQDTTQIPTTQRPSAGTQDTTQVPTTQRPSAGTQDTTQVPTTQKPSAGTQDTTEVPTTEAPFAGDSDTTEVPTTEAPFAGDSDTTEAPTTEAPFAGDSDTTEAPTTEAPSAGDSDTTEAPTTEAPSAGDSDTTEAPTTEEPSVQVPDTEDTTTSYAVISENGTSQVVLVANPSAKKEYTNESGETVLEISKKNKISIKKGGTYRFTQAESESLTGRIEVEAEGEDVTIILAGVNLTSDDVDGVLTVKKKCGNVNVILEEGTENVFTDTAAIETEEVTEEVTDETTGETTEVTTTETVYPDGAVVCKQKDLVISGSGALIVSSELGTGVKSTGSLTIQENAKVTVTAAGNNGISGKTALTIDNAEIDITSDGDGVKTTTPDDETDVTLGNMVLKDSKITVSSKEDGVQAYRNATITNCIMDITATKDNSKLTTVEGETKDSFKGIKAVVLTIEGGNYKVTAASDKAIKADTELNINGGVFDVTSGDDGIHCDGNINIDNDTTDITISAADDGIHANYALTVNSGKINITKSYEGLEGGDIIVNGGEIRLVSSDDGFNVAGGADQSGFGPGGNNGDQFRPSGPGGNMWGGYPGSSSSTEATTEAPATGDTSNTVNTSTYSLVINGGKIYMNANGDGLDSNGTINMTGGEVYVSGPTNGGNGAIDYEQSFNISGGILVACGSQGMDETPSASSSQCSVRFQTSAQQAGTVVTLKDASGNEVVSYAPEKQFSSIVISAPALEQGSSYTLYLNGTEYSTVTLTGVVTGGSSSGGMQPGGMW